MRYLFGFSRPQIFVRQVAHFISFSNYICDPNERQPVHLQKPTRLRSVYKILSFFVYLSFSFINIYCRMTQFFQTIYKLTDLGSPECILVVLNVFRNDIDTSLSIRSSLSLALRALATPTLTNFLTW